jgi:hypothetical protein
MGETAITLSPKLSEEQRNAVYAVAGMVLQPKSRKARTKLPCFARPKGRLAQRPVKYIQQDQYRCWGKQIFNDRKLDARDLMRTAIRQKGNIDAARFAMKALNQAVGGDGRVDARDVRQLRTRWQSAVSHWDGLNRVQPGGGFNNNLKSLGTMSVHWFYDVYVPHPNNIEKILASLRVMPGLNAQSAGNDALGTLVKSRVTGYGAIPITGEFAYTWKYNKRATTFQWRNRYEAIVKKTPKGWTVIWKNLHQPSAVARVGPIQWLQNAVIFTVTPDPQEPQRVSIEVTVTRQWDQGKHSPLADRAVQKHLTEELTREFRMMLQLFERALLSG